MSARSRSSVAAVAVAALAASALVGCSAPTPPSSLHNLERPTDVVFACVGMFGDGSQVSGRPMSECHVPGRFDPPPDVTRRTFGFVTNTARGELSVIDMDSSKLVDLDPSNPQPNVAPLGVLPEQISASDDGCRIVSANRGSCDLTLVDTGALVAPALALGAKVAAPSGVPRPISQQIVVRKGNGEPLKVAPYEAIFLPQDTSGVTAGADACQQPPAQPIGWKADPSAPEVGRKAVVTFPSCNLVALVDLPSGNILDSVTVLPGSDGKTVAVTEIGADPQCAETDFCDGSLPPDDAGGADAGGAPASPPDPNQDPFVNLTGTRPGPMAIRPGAERVYVGLGQAAFVVALDIRSGKLVKPAIGDTIQLYGRALGVNRVRLSVDPYRATGIPGQHGAFVGDGELHDRQYLYVIARDGTVRIIDVSRSTRLLPEIECDANIDPTRFPPEARAGDPRDACWPAYPPDTAHRLPLAQGPGIRLPGGVPRDVAAVDLTTLDPRRDWEGVLDGVYAFVLTSNGSIYIVNIAPTLRTITVNTSSVVVPATIPEVEPLVNSLRDRNILTYNTAQDPTVGPPRVDLAPTVPSIGPHILPISSTSARDNVLACPAGVAEGCVPPLAPTYVFLPERSAVHRQTWAVTWEGDLLSTSFSGQLALPKMPASDSDRRLALTDLGAGFCTSGVVPGDFVTLFGCTADNQCGPAQVCKRSDTAPESVGTLAINGLCVLTDPKLQAEQIAACAPLLESVRRYEIVEASAQALSLRPRLDEIVSESLATCSDPANLRKVCGPASDPSRKGFICAPDTSGNPRCLQPCGADPALSACRSGRSCVDGFCADAPAIPPAASFTDTFGKCINQLTAYRVGAGSSFLVQGTGPSVYIPGATNDDGTCRPNPLRTDRISIFQTVAGARQSLPLCSGVAEFNRAKPDQDGGMIDVNDLFLQRMTTSPVVSHSDAGAPAPPISTPCLMREYVDDPDAGAVTDAGSGEDAGVDGGSAGDAQADGAPPSPSGRTYTAYYALYQNRELRFVLANLEAYLGDSVQISFDVHGGFQPDTVLAPGSVQLDAPARLVVSPIDSQGQASDLSATHELPFLFVVDQRRLARASLGVGATRGQVLRVYSRKSTGANVNNLLPVYDDFTSSGGLWPVQ